MLKRWILGRCKWERIVCKDGGELREGRRVGGREGREEL